MSASAILSKSFSKLSLQCAALVTLHNSKKLNLKSSIVSYKRPYSQQTSSSYYTMKVKGRKRRKQNKGREEEESK